jgi:hypothetical protein
VLKTNGTNKTTPFIQIKYKKTPHKSSEKVRKNQKKSEKSEKSEKIRKIRINQKK